MNGFLLTLLVSFGLSSSLLAKPALYDSMYQYYAELCALTQTIDIENPNKNGGPMGHSALYLKGVCRDSSSEYPKLKMCENYTKEQSAEEDIGTGVSVNPLFGNASWTTVPTKTDFFWGGLDESVPLTDEVREATDKRMEIYYRGIEQNPKFVPQNLSGSALVSALTRGGMVIDYALAFSRNMYCARIPVTKPMMERAVSYLNNLNESYNQPGGPRYQWNQLSDNCAHMTHNAVAALGYWKYSATNVEEYTLLLNKMGIKNYFLAVPGNRYIHALDIGNNRDDWDPVQMYNDTLSRNAILIDGVLPSRDGVLEDFLPVHKYENHLYGTNTTLKVFDVYTQFLAGQLLIPNGPLFNEIKAAIEKLGTPNQQLLETLRSENYVRDMKEHFERFATIYDNVRSLVEKRLHDQPTGNPALDAEHLALRFIPSYQRLLKNYLGILDERIQAVHQNLQRLKLQ